MLRRGPEAHLHTERSFIDGGGEYVVVYVDSSGIRIALVLSKQSVDSRDELSYHCSVCTVAQLNGARGVDTDGMLIYTTHQEGHTRRKSNKLTARQVIPWTGPNIAPSKVNIICLGKLIMIGP